MRTLTVLSMILGLAVLAGCGDQGEQGAEAGHYAMVSGAQTGVYYPTAGAIARLANREHPNLHIEVQASGGSVENARKLARGEADFAIMQNDIAAYARQGTLMFEGDEPLTGILGVASLYPEHVQIVALKEAGIATVADLAGKRVAVGARGSGSEANALQIIEAAGLSMADLGAVEYIKPGMARDFLQDGRIDAAFFTAGVGNAAWLDAFSTMPDRLVLVPFGGEARARMLERYEFYREAVIPAGSYEGQSEDVPTVSVMATLVASEAVPAEAVHGVLEGIFNNLQEFQRTQARLQAVNLQDAQGNLTLPMHPGAQAFYAEAVTVEPETPEQDGEDAAAPAP